MNFMRQGRNAGRQPNRCCGGAKLWPLLVAVFLAICPNLLLAQNVDAPGAKGDSRIAGIVVSQTDAHLLGRARVTVRDARNPQNLRSLVTAEDGKFEFNDLLPGKYSLTGEKRGFITASYDQHDSFSTAIVTGAGLDTEHLVLKLAPDAIITGRVLDEAGEPIRHAALQLYRVNHAEGMDQINVFRTAVTDDLGVYELTPLTPGTYYLAATAKPWYAVHPYSQDPAGTRQDPDESNFDRSLDVAYSPTYYAGVTDSDSAQPIPIRGGERLQLDLHLTPVPALRLLLRVPEDQKHGIAAPRLEQRIFGGAATVFIDAQQVFSPGMVQITGIPAGRYDVQLHGPQAGGQASIELSRNGEQIDLTKMEASSSVKLMARMADGSSLPRQLVLGLHAKSGNVFGRLDEKGEEELENLAPGPYELVVLGQGTRYSITQVTADSAEVQGHTVTLTPGASASVRVSVVAGGASVEGTAKRGEKGFAGAMVVLVPKNPEGSRDLFRRDQSDLDGTFSLRAVVPGIYTVVAIENGWDLDWSRPEVISAYLQHGRVVEVKAGSRSSVRIPDAIKVVSR